MCSMISMDAFNMWSYEGWKEPQITVIFIFCIFIGCAMNFTTLHCTYINSAVTTSFVGVVKSIATITVGMLAFKDVSPTRLFISGVVVNTVGSITYCVVKYYETKKKSLYEDLEETEKDASQPQEDPYRERAAANGTGPTAGPDPGPTAGPDPGQPEPRGERSGDQAEEPASHLANGEFCGPGDGGLKSGVMTDQEALEMQREHLHRESASSGQSLRDGFAGAWRSIRLLHVTKEEHLVENMEVQSP